MSLKCILQGQNDKSLKLDDSALKQDNEDVTSQVKELVKPTLEEIGAAPVTHVADKNNPHNVTAEQVEAMPITPKTLSDTDNVLALSPGRYKYEGNSDKQVTSMNLPENAWHWEITVVAQSNSSGVTNNYKVIMATNISAGKVFCRMLNWDSWFDWQQIATAADLAGYLPLSGGVLSGTLTARGLTLSDYNTPFECSAYIDLHYPGTTEDFSGRIYVNGNKQLMYAGTGAGAVITSGNIGSYLAGCAKIEVGSYVGTGKATKSLVLPFSPKFLKIYTIDGFINKGYSRIGEKSTSYWISGMEYLAYISTADTSGAVGRPITVDGNTVSWVLNSYASSSAAEKAKEAMNTANYTYHYVAFG